MQIGRIMFSGTSIRLAVEVSRIIRKPSASGRASLMKM